MATIAKYGGFFSWAILFTVLCESPMLAQASNDCGQEMIKKETLILCLVIILIAAGLSLLPFLLLLVALWRWRRGENADWEYITEWMRRERTGQWQPRLFIYDTLMLATNNFHRKRKLGSGAFGTLYMGILEDGTRISVKKLSYIQERDQRICEFLNTTAHLAFKSHPNIVQLRGYGIMAAERYLVYEFFEHNLAEFLWGKASQKFGLSWKERIKICYGIASGLSYISESLSVTYQDIKATNILIDENFNPKIVDFGLAKFFPKQRNIKRNYLAPEYVRKGDSEVTEKTSVFSFGVLMLEILIGKQCVDFSWAGQKNHLKAWVHDCQKHDTLVELLQLQQEEVQTNRKVITAIAVAISCVQDDPQLRPTLSEIQEMLSLIII